MQLKKTVLSFVGATLLTASMTVPVLADTANGSITVGGSTAATIRLTVRDSSSVDQVPNFNFGTNLTPLGTGNVPLGISAYTHDRLGAVYARDQGSVDVKVSSNTAFSSEFSQTANEGNTLNVDELRYAPAGANRSFDSLSNRSSVPQTATSLGMTGAQTEAETVSHWYILRVFWTHDPGVLDTTITYAASNT